MLGYANHGNFKIIACPKNMLNGNRSLATRLGFRFEFAHRRANSIRWRKAIWVYHWVLPVPLLWPTRPLVFGHFGLGPHCDWDSGAFTEKGSWKHPRFDQHLKCINNWIGTRVFSTRIGLQGHDQFHIEWCVYVVELVFRWLCNINHIYIV